MRQRAHELLEKINALAGLSSFPNLSKLELDLLQQHLRDFYELIDNAKNTTVTVTTPAVNPVVAAVNEPAAEKKIVQQPVVDEPAIVAQKEETPPTKQQIETAKENPVQVTQRSIVQELPVVDVAVKQVSKGTEQKTINERVTGTGSLNEKWKNETAELHQKLSGKPLKELLDLNKRIAITSELFKGSSEQFGAAVAEFDTCANFEDAELLFNQMAQKNNWNAESQTVRLLHKLLRQRFGV